ncbi:hypothetical protein AcV5_003812 [Taiwanofungus camphoratus]|nr:hypothetical protein AcV5_003812 [Antrodia cinnamomea]
MAAVMTPTTVRNGLVSAAGYHVEIASGGHHNFCVDKPQAFIEEFFKSYPLVTEQLLASEGKAYFLTISQWPGQKPVPFIPVLDADFEVWFKKDSLWAAEDIEAVFDQDGDTCKAEARIISVINTDAGKTVKVKGFVMRDSKPVVEVVSVFFYCGHYSDYHNTFELIEEPDYEVELATEAAVGVFAIEGMVRLGR